MTEPQLALSTGPDPEMCAQVAHALCRLLADQRPGSAEAAETAVAVAVLARHAPLTDGQRHGVRVARQVIADIHAGRAGRADPAGQGPRRPSLTDYIVALTGNETFTCARLVDVVGPYAVLGSDRTAAAHRIHVAVNRDPRFRRHEHGVYTRVHHDR